MFALHHWHVATCKHIHVSHRSQRPEESHIRSAFGKNALGRATHQSPLPSPRPRPFASLVELPAAAEAKLDVNGEGMLWFEEVKGSRYLIGWAGVQGQSIR